MSAIKTPLPYTLFLVLLTAVSAFAPVAFAAGPLHDTLIRNALIYDGSGGLPYLGEVAIDGDRIAAAGRHVDGHGRTEVDAQG
ncbi:MAG: hypothetical protein ACRD3S_10190, partial [Terracidiphilus sp.]